MSIPAAYIGIILIWSTTPLAIKWSGESAGFLAGVSLRMFISVLVCAVIMSFMSRRLQWHRQALKVYFVASIGIFGSMMSVYWGAQFVESGLIAVIFGLTPIVKSSGTHFRRYWNFNNISTWCFFWQFIPSWDKRYFLCNVIAFR